MYLREGHVRKLRRSSEDSICAHELTFSCYKRLPLLNRDRTRRWLIEALHDSREKQSFELWAYVIMPEHVHVLLFPQDPTYQIKRVLQSIKQPVMRRALNYLRQTNPAWIERLRPSSGAQPHFLQPGGGYDRNATQPETAWKIVDYIHLNPVKRGLVGHAAEWAWSSARWYEGQGEILLPMDAAPH